jgi:hypothetical protein
MGFTTVGKKSLELGCAGANVINSYGHTFMAYGIYVSICEFTHKSLNFTCGIIESRSYGEKYNVDNIDPSC